MIAAGFYGINNQKNKALSMYKKALDLQPEDVRISNAIAKFYFDNKELDNAETQIETMLNNRPRKCLNYRTPAEVFMPPPGVALRI